MGSGPMDENPIGWTIEHSTETVPVAVGKVYEGGGGEMIEFDDDGNEIGRAEYVPVKVFDVPSLRQTHARIAATIQSTATRPSPIPRFGSANPDGDQ